MVQQRKNKVPDLAESGVVCMNKGNIEIRILTNNVGSVCPRDLKLLLGWNRTKAWEFLESMKRSGIVQKKTILSKFHYYTIDDPKVFKKELEVRLK